MVYSGTGPEDPWRRHYRPEKIEPVDMDESRIRKRSYQEFSEIRPSGFFAFLFLFLGNLLDRIEKILRKRDTSADHKFRDDLLLFQAALRMIMEEDVSQDTPFLRRLSKLWQITLEHSLQIVATSQLGIKLKAFIQDIGGYPQDAEHTL